VGKPAKLAKPFRNRIVGHGDEAVDQLLANPKNFRLHPDNQQQALAGSIDDIGFIRSVTVNKVTGCVVDGHLRVTLAMRSGVETIPVEYVELTEEEEAEALLTLDPTAAMAATDKQKLDDLMRQVQSDDERVQQMMADLAEREKLEYGKEPKGEDPGAQVDKAEELRVKWGVELGQLWQLGEHRLICGDCTTPEAFKRLMDGERVEMMLTDPPYCSGGFQEAGKKSGSIGTRGDEMIANDTLSTRGYTALIKSVLGVANPGIIYVFTDWRMWVNLFDCAESSGYGVRNMIVWDKGTPGMGRGWRSQHELVLCGMKVTQPFDPHKAQGNVIQCARTGNVNHPTEKPVDLLQTILDVNDLANVVYDPFSGSGSALIACEQVSKKFRGMELDPRFLAVTLERWSTMTGKTPVLME